MLGIPRAALALGLAGVLPFIASPLGLWLDIRVPFDLLFWWRLQVFYGLAILSFMSGCVWAFAARDEDATGYALSTLPTLGGVCVVLLIIPGSPGTADLVLICLAVLFALLLLLDVRASRRGQTPPWWLTLRLLLTTLVCASLAFGALV